jgi:hypothetical protein
MSDLFLKSIDLFFAAQIDCAVGLLFCGVESGEDGVNIARRVDSPRHARVTI